MATLERRNNRSKTRALSVLVALGMVLMALRHLSGALNSDPWYVGDTLRAAALAVAFSIALVLTPWPNLKIKCLMASMVGYYVSDTILCAGWYWLQWPDFLLASVIQGACFVLAALVYLRRSYDQSSDDVIPGYLYSVRTIPRNTQNFIISLAAIFGPDGAYSLYADGHLYKFSNGKLVKRRVSYLPPHVYHIERGAKITDDLLSRLDGLVGSEWSIKDNCLTVLGRIWRRHSGRAY